MAYITLYQGDERPVYVRTLTDENGNSIDLTGLTGSAITLEFVSSTPIIGQMPPFQGGGAVTIVTASTGVVSYQWVASDTKNPGTYLLWFILHWPGSPVQEQHVGPDTLVILPSPQDE